MRAAAPRFAERLATLPPVDHLAALVLHESGRPAGRIDHRPGQAGSLRIYHAVAVDGRIDASAARRALALYAEHLADAEAQPGRHPNIDRLLALIARDGVLELTAIAAIAAGGPTAD